MAGQADWLAFALPTEGKQAGKPRAGDVAHREVPTCLVTDRLGDVKAKVEGSGWNNCLVIDGRSIVLGRIGGDALEGDAGQLAGDVMEAGPTTVRPSEYLDALVKRMKKQDVETILVTTSIGELVGVLRRSDAERHLAENKAAG